MPIDLEKYLKKEEQVMRSFSASLMSNSKWLKLFKLIFENSEYIPKYTLIDIFDEYPRIVDNDNSEPFDKIYHSTGIKDVIIGGPCSFKTIKRIEFDLKQSEDFENKLSSIGKFVFERGENHIKIYGYK